MALALLQLVTLTSSIELALSFTVLERPRPSPPSFPQIGFRSAQATAASAQVTVEVAEPRKGASNLPSASWQHSISVVEATVTTLMVKTRMSEETYLQENLQENAECKFLCLRDT